MQYECRFIRFAGAYYGVPADIQATARKYVPNTLLEIVDRFENTVAQTPKIRHKIQLVVELSVFASWGRAKIV